MEQLKDVCNLRVKCLSVKREQRPSMSDVGSGIGRHTSVGKN